MVIKFVNKQHVGTTRISMFNVGNHFEIFVEISAGLVPVSFYLSKFLAKAIS